MAFLALLDRQHNAPPLGPCRPLTRTFAERPPTPNTRAGAGHGYTTIGGNFQYMAHYSILGSKAIATTYCGSYNTCAPIYLFDYRGGLYERR